jgi:hypothetical protein
MLSTYLDESECCPQLNKAIMSKRLRQDISQLISNVNVLHPQPCFFNTSLFYEVILRVFVLAAAVELRIPAQLNY